MFEVVLTTSDGDRVVNESADYAGALLYVAQQLGIGVTDVTTKGDDRWLATVSRDGETEQVLYTIAECED